MFFFVIYFVVGTNFVVATPKKVSNIYLPPSAFRNWLNLKLNTQSISLNWDSLKRRTVICEKNCLFTYDINGFKLTKQYMLKLLLTLVQGIS